MYEFPSASVMCEPWPDSKNRGVPPTERHALAGLFTPPGMSLVAVLKRFWELDVECEVVMATNHGSAWEGENHDCHDVE